MAFPVVGNPAYGDIQSPGPFVADTDRVLAPRRRCHFHNTHWPDIEGIMALVKTSKIAPDAAKPDAAKPDVARLTPPVAPPRVVKAGPRRAPAALAQRTVAERVAA